MTEHFCGICGLPIVNIREEEMKHPDGWTESFTVGDCKCGTNIHDFDGKDFCWCEK